ncbi:hypothetical protein PGIGA_G00171500 [Pangasianodon gigas]|uniref:Uncharacterized protein n=1 Tax=Pangasianodon gigas TaxID=30993 RepID=A0ACC5XU72_PANGG|nr:hypothetical protein [Pangasianodon gigas]
MILTRERRGMTQEKKPKWLLICQLLIILLVKDSLALTCMPCHEVQCPPDPTCPGGKVWGVCGCCLECAKVKNEKCGGLYGFSGTCDQGLECVHRGWDMFDSEGVCQEKATDDNGMSEKHRNREN